MDDLKRIQSEHFKCLLNDLADENISQKAFADIVGVSEVTVSNWKRGRQKINPSNAEEISRRFPHYSVQYLLGYAEYPNEDVALTARFNDAYQKGSVVHACVESLAEINGASIKREREHNVPNWDDLPYDPILDAVSFNEIEVTTTVILSRGNQSRRIPEEQWTCFVSEVQEYVDMRISSFLKRGY